MTQQRILYVQGLGASIVELYRLRFGLENKNAVIYGAGGAIGSAVARAFAKEGAHLFLAAHSIASLEHLVSEIESKGGKVDIATVDATSEHEVDNHFRSIVEKAGKIDISFNAMGISQTGVQGIPLIELSPESFALPILTYSKSHFLTAKAAAQHMVGNNAGVIITLTATPSSVAAPLVGGMAPAWAAIEALTRTFAGELGAYGVRVVCLRPELLNFPVAQL